MTLQVWADFEKKENSTIQPGTAQAVLDVKLKKDCSVLRPIFIISGELQDSVSHINYAAWNERFYWVTDVIFLTNNLAELHCKVDVLATYKGDIAGETQLVERSAQNYDPWIYDRTIIPEMKMQYWGNTEGVMPGGWNPGKGCFLIRVVGGGGTSETGITTYVMNSIGLNHVLQSIFNASNYDFLSDDTIKSFFNPFQYIVSVMWFPLTPTTVASGDYLHLKLGWWEVPNNSYAVVNQSSVVLSTIIKRPAELPEDFRAMSPQWTIMKLYLPGCGSFFVNPAEVASDLHVDYNIDLATGQVQVVVLGADRLYIVGTYEGVVGVPVSIGQLDVNASSTAKSLITGLGNVFSGNIGGALSSLTDAAQNVAQPTPSVNGTNGNRSSFVRFPSPKLYWYHYKSSGEDILRLGRMCMKKVKLSTLTGYIKCVNASIPLKGTEQERDEVNAYLNGGFYLE